MRDKRRSLLAGFSAEMMRRRVYPVIKGPPRAGAALGESPSVAVLPFTDMSQHKDQGYFCEGVAEAIVHALTKIEALHVAARMSLFRFASAGRDIRDIGRELGVSTVLEGSVRKSGDQLRVTAQLINAEDGYHIWSNTYERELRDIFAIQDEIATSIAESLLNTLMPVKTTSTRDVVAYEYYLRGRQFLNRFRKIDFKFARQMFQQGIERDPEFALAWASYADCFSARPCMQIQPPGSETKRVRPAIEAWRWIPDLPRHTHRPVSPTSSARNSRTRNWNSSGRHGRGRPVFRESRVTQF